MGKKKKNIKHYDSKMIRAKHVEETLKDIVKIQPRCEELIENREAIENFYHEKSLDKKWDKRRKMKK